MKRYLLVVVFIVLAGCARTSAPPYTYVPRGEKDLQLVIGARAVNAFFWDHIYITVNGEDALAGSVALWRMEDFLTGSYQGRKIEAYCYADNTSHMVQTKHHCTVTVEEEKIFRFIF